MSIPIIYVLNSKTGIYLSHLSSVLNTQHSTLLRTPLSYTRLGIEEYHCSVSELEILPLKHIWKLLKY